MNINFFVCTTSFRMFLPRLVSSLNPQSLEIIQFKAGEIYEIDDARESDIKRSMKKFGSFVKLYCHNESMWLRHSIQEWHQAVLVPEAESEPNWLLMNYDDKRISGYRYGCDWQVFWAGRKDRPEEKEFPNGINFSRRAGVELLGLKVQYQHEWYVYRNSNSEDPIRIVDGRPVGKFGCWGPGGRHWWFEGNLFDLLTNIESVELKLQQTGEMKSRHFVAWPSVTLLRGLGFQHQRDSRNNVDVFTHPRPVEFLGFYGSNVAAFRVQSCWPVEKLNRFQEKQLTVEEHDNVVVFQTVNHDEECLVRVIGLSSYEDFRTEVIHKKGSGVEQWLKDHRCDIR